MAAIVGLITINNKEILEVDLNPATGSGTPAPIGSLAVLDAGGAGEAYVKAGLADTEWDLVTTESALRAAINEGTYLRIPIYSTISTGFVIDDIVQQNSQNVTVDIVAQPGRTTPIGYHVPNPGNSVTSADFILSEGAQTKNGNMTFNNNVTVQGDFTVNGALTYINTTNTTITDKLITLNKGGLAASAAGSGLEFEENSTITGYFKQASARDGFLVKPSSSQELDLVFSGLTTNREQKLADTDGTFVMRPNTTLGVAGQVAFWQNANNLISESNLFWDSANARLGVGTNTPSSSLHVSGGVRITALIGPNPVKADANGNLSVSAINLTAEVSGVLPITNGGTNSGTALLNDRLMISSSGAIVEHTALTQGSILFANSSGLPSENNSSLFWDNSAGRLGVGTYAPSAKLHVVGGARITGLIGPHPVKADADGNLSVSAINLTSEVSGVLPVANGGTNSSTALSNNRLMISSGGAVVEHTALTQGSVLFVGPTGLPLEDNPNLFWDNANDRLGLGTSAPERLLDVQGPSIIRGSLKYADTGAPKNSWEMKQAQVTTTNATVTSLATLAIPDNSAVLLEARIIGRRTGGLAGTSGDAAVYVRTARFKNVGGVVTRLDLQTDYTSEDQTSWNGTLVVSGTSAVVQVKGALDNTVDWTVTYFYQTLS